MQSSHITSQSHNTHGTHTLIPNYSILPLTRGRNDHPTPFFYKRKLFRQGLPNWKKFLIGGSGVTTLKRYKGGGHSLLFFSFRSSPWKLPITRGHPSPFLKHGYFYPDNLSPRIIMCKGGIEIVHGGQPVAGACNTRSGHQSPKNRMTLVSTVQALFTFFFFFFHFWWTWAEPNCLFLQGAMFRRSRHMPSSYLELCVLFVSSVHLRLIIDYQLTWSATQDLFKFPIRLFKMW